MQDSHRGYVNKNNYSGGSFLTQTNAVCIDETPCFQSVIGGNSIRSSISNLKPKMLSDEFHFNTQPIAIVQENLQRETNESDEEIMTEDSQTLQS